MPVNPVSSAPQTTPPTDAPPPPNPTPKTAAKPDGDRIDAQGKPAAPAAGTPPATAPTPRAPKTGKAQAKAAARAVPRTWDYPKGTTGGVFLSSGKDPHPIDLVKEAAETFKGSKTYLWYKSIAAVPTSLPPAFFEAAKAAGVTPQLGFESGEYNLPTLRRALEGKGALPETNARNIEANGIYESLAAWADYLKDQGPVIFRPLSEMNDASGAWELGKADNEPADYAKVWNGMRALFDEHGATNLRWSLDVLAVAGNPRLDKVRQVLALIPPGHIDNIAMNPYSMQVKGELESFASLVKPWLALFKKTGHGKARPVVSEMGVSNNSKSHNVPGNKDASYVVAGTEAYEKLDRKRAAWIHAAFAFARENNFASVTYFTQMDTNWRVDAGSKAMAALQEEIARK